MFRVHEVRKRYADQVALESTTLAVEPGETLALIGPSGSGKSTLLRLLMGLIAPDAGRLEFGDLVIDAASAPAMRERIGYVTQDGGLFPHLTAARNAALKAADLGWPRERIRTRLAELAALVGLEPPLLERFPTQLSGGQRQRVSLVRALMLDPEAVLLDEPLGALDPMIRSRLQEDLRRIFRELRKTVVLVTHDLAEAAYLGDRIALMRDGRLLQVGRYADLVAHPAAPFVTEFIQAQRTLHAAAVGA